MNDVVVTYAQEQISVPKEVADFLEADRKHMQAQRKQDRRHLSKRDFETVPSRRKANPRELEDLALRNLLLEKLHSAITLLSDHERELIVLYYEHELSMEAIGKRFGISKMSISKQLKKLYAKLRRSVETERLSFFLSIFGLQTFHECPKN